MAHRLSAKLAAFGTTGVLAATALVAAATGAANADSATVSNSTPITYTCALPTGGTVNLADIFTIPSTIAVGVGAPDANVSLAATMDADSVKNLDAALTGLGMSSFSGSMTGGFGYTGGTAPMEGTFAIPTTQAPPEGSPYTMDVTGTMTAPATGSGTATIYSPAALSLNISVGGTLFPIACPLSPATQSTAIASATLGFPAAGTDVASASDKGAVITYTAGVTDGKGGTTPGTGSVSYSFKGNVAKVKVVKKGKKKVKKTTYVAKKIKGSATLDSTGQATINLAKYKLKKGSYSVTLTWDDQSTVVAAKIG